MRKIVLVALTLLGCSSSSGSAPTGGDDDQTEAGASPDASLPGDASLADAGVPGEDASSTDAASDASSGDAGPDATAAARPFFLIGGQDQRHLLSRDGKTWTNDTYIAPNGLDDAFDCALIEGGIALLSGDPGVLRSTDGTTWTTVIKAGSTSFHGSQMGSGAGSFVLVTSSDAFKSPDGITWTHATDTGSSGHWQGVVYGGGHWVAIGDGHTKASEDGLTWHDYTATADANPFAAITYGNGVFVAVGARNNMARIATTTDGVTWKEQSPVATLYNSGFGGVAFGGGKFLASDCCSAFESADGATWTKRGSGAQGTIVYGAGSFVAAGWRTSAWIYDGDAGSFVSTFSGDEPNKYQDGGLAPWFISVAAGELP